MNMTYIYHYFSHKMELIDDNSSYTYTKCISDISAYS